MRLWMVLLLFFYHPIECSEESMESVEHETTPPELCPSVVEEVCPASFLAVLLYRSCEVLRLCLRWRQSPLTLSEMEPDDEDDLPSFADFKQKMGNQGMDMLEVRLSSGSPVTRNYASIECGAKVIETNPNARNPSHILNSNKDEYLINDCSSPIHFVVELCELVNVRSIVIASLELFSSTPKSFKVFTAERYETEDNSSWSYIGTFLAANERSEQSFPLSNEEQVYAKYIKVLMESHYGQERLCPINTFKVLGASMIDVYEASQQKVGTATSHSVIPGSTTESDDDNSPDSSEDTQQSDYNGTLLSAAKDAVLRILEQPIEFLGTVIKPDGKALNGNHDNPTDEIHRTDHAPVDDLQSQDPPPTPAEHKDCEASKNHREKPVKRLLNSPDTTKADDKNVEELLDNNSVKTLEEEMSLEHPFEEVTSQLQPISNTLPQMSSEEENIKKEVMVEQRLSHNIHTELKQLPTDTSSEQLGPSQIEDCSILGAGQSNPPIQTDQLGPTMTPDIEDSPVVESLSDKALGPTVAPYIEEVPILNGESPIPEGEPPIAAPGTEPTQTLNSHSSTENRIDSQSTSIDDHTPENTAIGNETAASVQGNVSNHSSTELNATSQASSSGRASNTSLNGSTLGNGGGKNGKNESETVVLTNGHVAPRDKEKSVFLRLSNQIKELELNMSLFSSYLDQISTGLKKSKNKTEESAKSLNKRLTIINETLQLLGNKTDLKVKFLADLSTELGALTEAVIDNTLELAKLDKNIILLFLLVGLNAMIVISLLIICCLVQTCNHRALRQELLAIHHTLNLLSQQRAFQQHNGIDHSSLLGRDSLSSSCSLPILQFPPESLDAGNHEGEWKVAESRHRKKHKLKTR